MIIALAQTRPVRGDIPANIDGHVRLIEAAVARGAEVVAFPELSLTGYEPALAWELAVDVSDPRLEVFQRLSDARRVTLAIGLPTRATPRPRISLALFSPGASPWFYSKRYLHADEEPFFFPGDAGMSTLGTIALIAFSAPIDLAECIFEASPTDAPVAGDFVVTIDDATDGDGVPITATIGVTVTPGF